MYFATLLEGQEKQINRQKRIHSLDLIRFIAFLLVFCSHFPTNKWWYDDILFSWGSIGVSIFFVLSGYLIATSLENVSSNSSKALISFYTKRLLRIIPMYLVVVAVAYFLKVPNYINQYIANYPEFYDSELWSLLTFTENYFFITHSTLPERLPLMVFWTLCIEMHFYLLAPFIYKLFKFLGGKETLLVFISITFLTRFYHFTQQNILVDLFSFLDHFALGMFLVINTNKNTKPIHRSQFLLLLIGFLLTLFFTGSIYRNWASAYFMLWPTVIAVLSVKLIESALRLRLGMNNAFSKAGKYTYSLYLLHTLVIGLVIDLPFRVNYFTGFSIALVGSILLSFIAYNVIEKPAISFSRRMSIKRY